MAGEDKDYLERVIRLPCVARGMSVAHQCGGEMVAHHRSTGRVARAPVKGADRRSHDHDAIPLCAIHHGQWHDAKGPFKVLIRSEREAWEAEQVHRTQRILKPIGAIGR